MNFLERNGANLRPGNVVFTMILLTGVLGMCAYLYTTYSLGVHSHEIHLFKTVPELLLLDGSPVQRQEL